MDGLTKDPNDSLFANRSYPFFITSRVLSSLAFQSIAIAMGWMMYDLTRSAFMLGMVGLCQFLPMLLLTFVVGQIADHFDRRFIGLLCQFLEAATTLVLAIIVWYGALSAAGILVAAVILGAAQAFERPTMAALLPSILPARLVPSAVATSTSFMQTANIVGPSAGGLLYGLGATVPFVVSTLLFGLAAISVISIRKTARPSMREPVTLATVFAGVAFIRRQPIMLATISLDLFAVLLGGTIALLPIFASDILQAGPWALGLLRAAPAVGALSMSVWFAWNPLESGAGKKMLWAVAVFGLATIVFGLSENIALSVGALFVAGAADTVSVVVRISLVQLLTPDEMRGRVNAVNSLFIGTSNQLGEFESGVAASLVGPVAACVLGGVGTVAIVLIWMRLFPQLARVEKLTG